MPSISAAELRERMDRDLPGIVVPQEAPGAGSEPRTHEKVRPDFLRTNDTVVVTDRLIEAITYLRDTLGYTYLSDIAVVDFLADGVFEVVYRFYHLEGNGGLALKVRVPRDQPDVPSLTTIWPGADFHEREGFDLFGVNFVGHPYLKRIYMWDELEGHPMRKDFLKQGDKYFDEGD